MLVEAQVDCPACGERVPEHYRFCGHCGAPLAALEAPAAQITAPAEQQLESAERLSDQGFQLVQAKKWSQAIQVYRKAIDIEPDYRKTYWNLGFAYNRIGNYAAALETLSKGLDLPPKPRDYRAGMLYERSISLGNLKRYEDALSDINESLRLNPGSVRSLYFRGRVNQLRGSLEAAVADAREVLRLNPDHSAALRMIEQITTRRH